MRCPEEHDIDRPVGRVLLFGMLLSCVLMLTGFVMSLMRPGHIGDVLPLHLALREAWRLHPSGWLSLGILALILTPVARVVTAIVGFAWVRDWRYVVVSVIVLAAMLTGLFLGKG